MATAIANTVPLRPAPPVVEAHPLLVDGAAAPTAQTCVDASHTLPATQSDDDAQRVAHSPWTEQTYGVQSSTTPVADFEVCASMHVAPLTHMPDAQLLPTAQSASIAHGLAQPPDAAPHQQTPTLQRLELQSVAAVQGSPFAWPGTNA